MNACGHHRCQMATTRLYIATYDIADPRRLYRLRQAVRQHATGGQKSVFECFLTSAAHHELTVRALSIIDEGKDRFALLQVEERTKSVLLGTATPAVHPDFQYIG